MSDTIAGISSVGATETDTNTASADDKIAVYYNSACPVCRRGIEWQKGQMSACAIEWIDVHASPDAVAQIGAGLGRDDFESSAIESSGLESADLESVRERLHVRDAQGRVLIGADAVAFVMERTPGQRWMGRFASLPMIRPAMRWAYDAFARVLYRWNRSKGRW
jgi:predicted DCC family thiol-disulfide oxidoreductase YuxK